MLESEPLRYDPKAFELSCPPGGAPRARLDTPQSRLIAASSVGDLEAIGRALSEPAVRLDLDHPLRLAAKHRHGEAVRLLIGRGASISRAFSPSHTPTRYGKRARLVEFLGSCGIDAEFILALPRPHGPATKRRARQRRGASAMSSGRAREAAAKREAWVARRDALRMRRVLKNHHGLIEEVLAAVRRDAEAAGHIDRAVRTVLFEHGIPDPQRRLSSVIVRKLHGEGRVSEPAAYSGQGI